MHRQKLVPMSFAEMELSNNRKRMTRLAEIQSQLVLRDRKNNNMELFLSELRKQNESLKQRLWEKQKIDKLSNKYSNTVNAFYKANCLLNSKIQNTTKQSAQSNQGTFPFAFNRQQINNKISNKGQLLVQPEKRRTVSFFDGYANDKNTNDRVRLSKQVYVAHPHLKEEVNQNVPPVLKNKKQFSFKKELKNQSMVELKNNETRLFQNVNQSEAHKASSRFVQFKNKLVQPERSQTGNRWNSEEAQFQIKSDMFSRNKPTDPQKRKTFLSIVSQSSRAKQC